MQFQVNLNNQSSEEEYEKQKHHRPPLLGVPWGHESGLL